MQLTRNGVKSRFDRKVKLARNAAKRKNMAPKIKKNLIREIRKQSKSPFL